MCSLCLSTISNNIYMQVHAYFYLCWDWEEITSLYFLVNCWPTRIFPGSWWMTLNLTSNVYNFISWDFILSKFIFQMKKHWTESICYSLFYYLRNLILESMRTENEWNYDETLGFLQILSNFYTFYLEKIFLSVPMF